MKKVAIFGGTFNPFHNGHKHILKEVNQKLKFDRIDVIPSKIPPHKSANDLADDQDRMNMTTLAISGVPNAKVSDIEIKREGKSYSYYTVKEYSDMCKSKSYKLFFIIGSDMLISFKKWYRYKDILSMCTLVCASRRIIDNEDIFKAKEELEKEGGQVILVSVNPLEVSSSQIREAIKSNKANIISDYLDSNVFDYIKGRHLYSDNND